ncbi:AbfB domain-containing protein [Streptomyces sp. NPDC093109]|uniref:AbfB domain-containing protein n=1 Tax=Streptomyces sp. NPDC093109 TaxID=3154977 RepID=UPI00344CEC90
MAGAPPGHALGPVPVPAFGTAPTSAFGTHPGAAFGSGPAFGSGTGFGSGAAFGSGSGSVFGSGGGAGHGPGSGPDPDPARWDDDPAPEPSRLSLVRNTVLVGVATLAVGIGLAFYAGPGNRDAHQAASPLSDGSLPQPGGLRAFPAQGTDTEPGDVTDSGDNQTGTAGDSELSQVDGGDSTQTGSTGSASGGTTTDKGKKSDKSDAKDKGDDDSGSGSGSESGKESESGSGSDKGSGSGSGSGGGGSDAPPPAASRQRAMQSINYPDRYWHIRDDFAFLDVVKRDDAAYTVIDGFADSDCYSFSLGGGRYLRHSNFRLRASTNDGSTSFKQDATFCPRPTTYAGGNNGGWGSGWGGGWGGSGSGSGSTGTQKVSDDDPMMLESYNYPGRFIRHRNFQLWLDSYQFSALFQADSTFRMVKK